jgi:hypothetical protein
MFKKSTVVASLALACGLLSASAAQAALTMYTSRTAFTSALSNVVSDAYDDLTAGATYLSPAVGALGSYGYTVAAPGGLYGAGTAPDVWLGTFDAVDSLSFGSFTGGVSGAGAEFFLTDAAGDFAANGNFTVTGFDASGSLSLTFAFSSLTNFVGFISDAGGVTAVVVSNNQPGSTSADSRFVTANNLTLGALDLPEPGTYALVLAALALLPLAGRRKSA